MQMHRFEVPPGIPYALEDRMLAASYRGRDTESPAYESRDGVAIVTVTGPLLQKGGGWCDSYEAIESRVAEALASRPRAVLLALDTPGGMAQGCIESGRKLRSMASAARVPLLAWTDGLACSAGYALACAAERIYCAPSAIVGSIGTISGLLSFSKALAQFGVDYEIVASGERKGDGHPARPIDQGARDATARLVGSFADMFFGWVHEARPHLSTDAIRALQADVFVGARAVSVGIVDQVASLDEVIAIATRSQPSATAAPARAGKSTTGGAGARKESTSMGTRVGAEMAEVELQGLREAMGMMEQPPQEVVDAAAARINEQNAEGGEGSDGEGGEAATSEETNALRAQLATTTATLEALREQAAGLSAQVAQLQPIAAEHARRQRESAIDEAMEKRGMKGHASRARFVDLAEKHGLDAALASIDAAHVPPSGSPIPKGAHRSRDTSAPEAQLVAGGAQTDDERIVAEARELVPALKAQHPNEPDHVLLSRAMRQVKAGKR